MAEGRSFIKMATHMKERLRLAYYKARDNSDGRTEQFTKVDLIKIKSVERVVMIGMTEVVIKATF